MSNFGPGAGWYPDPQGSPRLRYWDGAAWSGFLHPAVDVDGLESAGRKARIAVLVGIPVQVAAAQLNRVQVHNARTTIREVRRQMDEMDRTQGSGSRPFTTTTQVNGTQLFGPIVSLPTLLIAVFFLLWFHKAATVARQLGRPARRTPGWAVGGWFIPIGNLFLPYQSARDLFRPGEPGRSSVGRWWGAYLAAGVLSSVVVVVAAIAGGAATGIAALALSAVLWLAAGLAALDFIDRADTSLRAEGGRR